MENYEKVELTEDGFTELCARVASKMVTELRVAGIVNNNEADAMISLLALYTARVSDAIRDYNFMEIEFNGTNIA